VSSIFLSHSHADKPFARKLADDLKSHGVRVWLDEAELQIGDSLIEKLEEAIDAVDYLGVVLSPSSVTSKWVKREVAIAFEHEIEGKRVKVLPLLIADCELPGFLRTKLYADFRSDTEYVATLDRLLRRLGIQTRRVSSEPELFTLLSGAIATGDPALISQAVQGFLATPRGAYDGIVADVLGSIATWNDRTVRRQEVFEVVARVVLDALSADETSGLAAVRYLRIMNRYFSQSPPKPIVVAPASAILAERVGANLCLYAYS
jgi:hypothetical protein